MEGAVGTPASLPAGTRFGSFVLARPLAAGGMAELYLAARPGPGGVVQLVAIKRLLPHLGWDPEFVRMFLDEVRIAASLAHPNIVRVIDFGVGEGGHYLAMEYLHGRNLRAIQRSVGTSGPLPLGFSVGTIMEIGAGLHAAHEHRDPDGNALEVVHRDVSPSNVLVTFDGRVVLVDFGIARVTEQTQMTRAGTLKGKVGYMSPEQCRGDRVDRRSDVFGLGILLYELTVGRRAFFADNDYAVIGKICDGDFPRPSEVMPGYPGQLEAIVTRALEVEPEDRFPTAALMIEQLHRFAITHGLDVGPWARASELMARFGAEPVPTVDLAALRVSAAPPRKGSSPLRWVALAGLGVVIGGLGFVAGGWVNDDGGAAATEGVRAEGAAPSSEDEVTPASAEVDPEPEPAVAAEPEPEPKVEAEASGAEPPPDETLEIDDEPVGSTGVEDEGGAEAPGRSRRGRRKKKARTDPKGDPEALLPPSWREG